MASGGQAGYADAWLNSLGVLSQATQRANYDRAGQPGRRPAARCRREFATDEYEFYLQDSWQMRSNLTVTAGVRYSLYSPPYEVNGLQVQPTISMGEWFAERVAQHAGGHSVERQPDRDVRPVWARRTTGPGFYAWDKNNFAPALLVRVEPDGARGRVLALLHRRQRSS